HPFEYRLRDEERPVAINLELEVEVFFRDLGELLFQVCARVVDQHRDRTEFVLGRLNRGEYLIALRDIGRRHQRLAALLANEVRGLFELGFGSRDKSAGVALARE